MTANHPNPLTRSGNAGVSPPAGRPFPQASRRPSFPLCTRFGRPVTGLGNGSRESRDAARNRLTVRARGQNLSAEDSPQKVVRLTFDPALQLGQVLMQPDSLAVRVRVYLLAEVTSGRLRAGERINEAELARKLGISRNPIREAISGLVEKGFLVARPRRGAELRTFTAQDVEDIFSFRACVEQFALAQAMAVMNDDERAEFPALVEEMSAAASRGDVAAMQNLDMRFHRRICELSRNRVTLRAFETIETEVGMLIASVDLATEPLDASAALHRPLAEAIREDRREEAERELGTHIARTHRFVLQARAKALADEGNGGGRGSSTGNARPA